MLTGAANLELLGPEFGGATFRLKLSSYLEVDTCTLLITINCTSITVSYFCIFINTMQFYNDLTDIDDKINLTGYSFFNNDVTHNIYIYIYICIYITFADRSSQYIYLSN